ncbi:MAG: cryptochrome/photolyase family protein [Alcanivorax sp.]|nr:cryptochrome/photolyase family protein [Alcanivorax sp.]
MPGKLVLILGDQLTDTMSCLAAADPQRDKVVMAEVWAEATYVRHHKKKIILIFSAMRHFADTLRKKGWHVDYYTINNTINDGLPDIATAVAHSATQHQSERIVTTECGEWRLDQDIRSWPERLRLPVEILTDDRFLCDKARFADWASGRKQLRMEYFYRDMRRQTGLLMTADGQPEGGQWNFDADNRKRFDGSRPLARPMQFTPDAITQAVIQDVGTHFPDHFGDSTPFWLPVTRKQARQALTHFMDKGLPAFGDYQDAMTSADDFLFHSVLSPAINCGLLTPSEVCHAAAERYYSGHAPLNAVEGFIRQIIGWREYVRGIYWLTMPEYRDENRLESHAPLPWFYWDGNTRMRCVSEAIRATREHAYAHHIQRLMVTGNLALLLGVDVKAIHEWYLAVYADAYEWVELPNTLGMVMHADGGYLGSKPYAASGKYIQRMSDYCADCPYSVSTAEQDNSCPFNSLYWHFIQRHEKRFAKHPRMAMIYRSWDKMDSKKRARIIARAEALLENVDQL